MGEVVDFQKAKEEIAENKTNENVDTLKQQIADNMMLQKCIKVVSNIPLYDVDPETNEVIDKDYDYPALLEEYKANALANKEKFESLGEPSETQTSFYYQLFQMGYRTFGAKFFKQMCMNEVNCVQMFIGIWSIIAGLEEMSNATVDMDNELRAYKSIKLTDEQKEKLAEELKKTPEEYMQEMMQTVEELEKSSEAEQASEDKIEE